MLKCSGVQRFNAVSMAVRYMSRIAAGTSWLEYVMRGGGNQGAIALKSEADGVFHTMSRLRFRGRHPASAKRRKHVANRTERMLPPISTVFDERVAFIG